MNSNEIKITRTIPAPREMVFKYFTQRELIEQWSAPEGMTLSLPVFDAKVGGRFRYEHTDQNGGKYLGEGRITELVPNEKMIQLCEYMKNPEGKLLGENVEDSITFKDSSAGTEVTVLSRGNFDDDFKKECEAGWAQCFDKLVNLIAKETGPGYSGKSGEFRPNV